MSWIELVAQRHPPKAPQGMSPPENAKDWFRMEATPGEEDSTDIYVYESIGGWFGMWAEDFIYQLQQVTSSKINLRLNSPGGSVFEGIAIANAIRSHPADVTVYVDALAASIASVIALAGNRIVMMPQSQFMVHNASGACYGDATEMTKMADLLDKQSRNIAQAYAEHTGGSLADWQDYMAAETWFTAEEAVAAGLADEVMPMKPRQDDDAQEPAAATAQAARSWDLSMYTYAGREKAPAPVIKQTPADVQVGAVVTAALLSGVQAPTAEHTISLAVGSPEFRAFLLEAVRKEIQQQQQGAADTGGGEQETAAVQTQPAEKVSPEGPGDQQPVVPVDAEAAPVEEHVPEESPPDEADTTAETHDEADDWSAVIGLLHSPTSPGADDVFAQLKEGW